MLNYERNKATGHFWPHFFACWYLTGHIASWPKKAYFLRIILNKGRNGTNHGLFRKSLTVKTVAD